MDERAGRWAGRFHLDVDVVLWLGESIEQVDEDVTRLGVTRKETRGYKQSGGGLVLLCCMAFRRVSIWDAFHI